MYAQPLQPVAHAAGLLARVEDLNRLIQDGRLLDAHDRYYADEVVQQENELPPTVGKDTNRRREEEFLDQVTEFRDAHVLSVAVDPVNDVTMVEWFFDYDHREWGTRRYHQISVQRWRDGRIVHERYYYGS